MDGFLKQVASDLYGRYGDDISSLYVLLPNRRAGLFFGEALSEIIDRPLWQPQSVTVDQLMEEISGLTACDRIRLITELYKIYAEYHSGESFDTFYFWGELLLGDFDSIDKYLIDADTLFSNLVDLHELDGRFDYLSPEQKAVIAKFWRSFGQESDFSPHQKDFMTIWRTLAPVYHEFRARLQRLGIAYQGMAYREAAERIRDGRAPQITERRYAIVGFNALSKCEQVLFDWLRKNFAVDFYWDYDEYYVPDEVQEAGMFMRDNLLRFPSVTSLSGGYRNFEKPKKIRSVSTASNVLQCKYAGNALADIAKRKGSAPGKETAIVLTDESLLAPLLWSLPAEVKEINITMGYPLKMHPAYTFLERLMELQNRRRTGRNTLAFYHSDVEGLMRHPYLADKSGDTNVFKAQYVYLNAERLKTSPIYEKIFTAPADWRQLSDYLIEVTAQVANLPFDGGDAFQRTEFFAVITEHIRTLANSLDGCEIDLSTKIYMSLLRRSLQSVTVPFDGEPLAGVQIMGILETRALDFENIIFLSMNDSNSPGNLTGAPSFIPYNLKMAYGLPTPEHHEGVYAYHFFRLIQRAKNIDMVWSSTSDDKNSGEPSRYIYQLDYESPHDVEKDEVTVDVNLSPTKPVKVEKSPDIMEKLAVFLTGPRRKLSPSLFFTYVECPLKFYFRGVAGLKSCEELPEEVDNAMFGNILHLAMEKLYTPLVGAHNPNEHIREIIGSQKIEDAVTRAIAELYVKEEEIRPEDWGGNMILVHKTIVDYIDRNILPFDAAQGGFTIEKLEEWISADVDFNLGVETRTVSFCGKVDRLDRLADGTLRVVDYKTGSPKTKNQDNERFLSIDALFAGKSEERISAVLQTLLYAMMLHTGGETKVQPSLYYVKNLSKDGYSPLFSETGGDGNSSGSDTGKGKKAKVRTVEQYGDYSEEFEDRLREVMSEMFDPSVPFTQCEASLPCQWCDFSTICQR